ncbi:hypothetical protein LCGC14_2939950 [marine sediment metagenome]|uniref:HNH nuclease domain-containing protein n=1 Tax=marine sediment metagenome TaxID=412755 RepID=A0A0F8Y5B2_9ZZZZ
MGRKNHYKMPLPMSRAPLDAIVRLLTGVEIVEHELEGKTWDCWVHPERSKTGKGYTRIKVNGKTQWAHRVSYATFNGSIPDCETVNHKCRNTPCINPDHLELMSIERNAEHRHEQEKQDKEVPF